MLSRLLLVHESSWPQELQDLSAGETVMEASRARDVAFLLVRLHYTTGSRGQTIYVQGKVPKVWSPFLTARLLLHPILKVAGVFACSFGVP